MHPGRLRPYRAQTLPPGAGAVFDALDEMPDCGKEMLEEWYKRRKKGGP
jgi:hypothetical protein